MISSSENISPTESGAQKPSRFWMKTGIILSFIIFLLWLIPFFFSNILFSTPIKQGFSNLSKHHFTLTFKDLRINIFTGKIIFYDAQINPSELNDSTDNSSLHFRSDILTFQHIDFIAWKNERVLKFKKIQMNQPYLKLDNSNSQNNRQTLNFPLSAYFKTLNVLNFNVINAEISYQLGKDTISIPALSFELQGLQIDSLSDTVKTNRYHYSNIELSIQNQRFNLPDKSETLYWKSLKLSTKEKYFELEGFNIKPADSLNNELSYTAEIPKFRLEDFDFDSLLNKRILLSKSMILDINKLNIDVKNTSENTLNNEKIYALFKDNFNRIDIESVQVGINKNQIHLPKQKQLRFLGKSIYYLEAFRFNPENDIHFTVADAAFTINDLIYDNLISKQKLQLGQIQLNYDKKYISVSGVDYLSDSTEAYKLQLNEVQLENIDLVKLVNQYKLLADNLYLQGGNLIQLKTLKYNKSLIQLKDLDSIFIPVFRLIQIKNIQIEDWNFRIASKGFEIKNINAQLRQVQLPGSPYLAFGSFSSFDSKIGQLSWLSEDQGHHYLASNIEVSSESQEINIQKIQSFPRWKSLKNETLEEKAHFKLYAENIRMTTQNPFYQIRVKDTLTFKNFSVDSLTLTQFGKNTPSQKQKSNIPSIQLLSFELKRAEFTAYNDKSILNRLAQINGIHIMGDSLLILNDSLPNLHYKHLLAITKTGFYQNKAQGLSFDFEKIDYDSKEELFGIYQMKAELRSDNPEISSQHNLNSKLIRIKGFDHNLFLAQNQISAQEFNMTDPVIISKSNSNKKTSQSNFKDLFSAQNLDRLPYLAFDRFEVHDFTWLATFTQGANTSITTFEKGNLKANDFRLSTQSFNDPKRLFFSKSINFKVENIRQHFHNGNYLLLVDHIDFSSLQKQMNFVNIQFYTLQKAKQNNYNFNIDRISLNDIDFAYYQHTFGLSIDNIVIQNPNTKLRLTGFNENSGIKNISSLNLYPIIEPYFSLVDIRAIDIRNMTLNLETPRENSVNLYTLDHLNLQMNNFRVDSVTRAFENNRFFYSKNTLVHLRNYSSQIANDLYRLDFRNLRLSTLSGIVNIDSISLKPQYNYADFANRMHYQTDRFDVEVANIKLSGINFQDALFRQKYKIQHAQINNLNGEAYRNGLYPRRPNYYPKNPLQRLLALPYFLEIDSLIIDNSNFAYKELGENTNKPGIIFFDDLNVQILNATNNPDYIKSGGNTLLKAQAMLMGQSMLNMEANFPLSDGGTSFHLDAHLNRIEMDDLEPILRPLALIQAKSGTIRSLSLSVDANDDYAYGDMLMLYDHVKVEVLNKWMKKGFLGTLLANMLIKSENPSYLIPRKGPIYFERNKMRSIFNYWAEISILGMKTSMGLADRRTAKKVKKLKKGRL